MQHILYHLFKKNTLQEIPIETLQQLTEAYPFFAIGQFLLARKLQEIESPGYAAQFQKTLIYFYNPLWLQFQLTAQRPEEEIRELVNKDFQEIRETVVESTNVPAVTYNDMIEEVVLHQEPVYSNPGEMPDAQQQVFEAISAEQVIKHAEAEKQTIQREEPFTFQAFYTVDYFASQGIKLNPDNPQQDKLGKQLKSFTEWLKTMRRLPESSVVEILDKINDGEIAQIAAHSLEEKEVLTEAMAEVLVKQGQYEKARDLYHKLSLLNPHKSTYFATKIEDLKQ